MMIDDNLFTLNITTAPAAASRPKKKKKNNRYERRRQKAARAKALKQQQQAQAVASSSFNTGAKKNEEHEEEELSTAAIKEASRPSSMKETTSPVASFPDETKSDAATNESLSSDEKDEIDGDDDYSSSSSSDSESEEDTIKQEEKKPASVHKRCLEVLKQKQESRPSLQQHNPAASKNKNDSNAKQVKDDDYASRAAYLAEFHARPYELDRRAGATKKKKALSQESTHLWHDTDSWEALPLHPRLVPKKHATRPTVIQTRTIQAFFNNNNSSSNLFVHSETGSGKTLAYLLPIVQSLLQDSTSMQNRQSAGTRCLIVCPTRELALQTMEVAQHVCCSFSSSSIVPGCCSGQERRKSEKARLRKGLTILIGTPGRLLDHLQRTECLTVALGQLQFLVLDEADRLLDDAGLGAQVQHIVQHLTSAAASSSWRSILVSATVTKEVERLAKETLKSSSGNSQKWVYVKGDQNKSNGNKKTEHDDATKEPQKQQQDDSDKQQQQQLADCNPRQLVQSSVTVSAKLRLTALLAFLTPRVEERTVVFVSTCAAVDYYHALLNAMDCILPLSNNNKSKNKGIFGSQCPIYKLHGNVPHGERQRVLKQFLHGGETSSTSDDAAATITNRGSILLTTDVSARGLNFPATDWIVQFDPPADVSDYVHRAGRVARAGHAGHSLLFLLPSERNFLEILKQRGIQSMSAVSLTSTLNAAAGICTELTERGVVRSGGGLQSNKTSSSINSNSRSGEAFCSELQHRLEDCVVQDDIRAKAAAAQKAKNEKEQKKKKKRKGKAREEVSGELLELARKAFLSHIRAYPTKEKCIRHLFSAKALHLGHVARSFALKEPPKKLAGNGGTKKRRAAEKDKTFDEETEGANSNKTLAFDFSTNNGSKQRQSKRPRVVDNNRHSARSVVITTDAATLNPGKARSLLMANAVKLQSHGLDSL